MLVTMLYTQVSRDLWRTRDHSGENKLFQVKERGFLCPTNENKTHCGIQNFNFSYVILH